jgi:hypothetical protein
LIFLRNYLGNNSIDGQGKLTEREVAMLVICAGRQAGFAVKTEISVITNTKNLKGNFVRGKIDIGWYKEGKLIAVWEIDGQDAGIFHFSGNAKKGTAGNIAKFVAAECAYKIQVLYSLKNNLDRKSNSKRCSIQGWLNGNAHLVTDEELMEPEGIEALTEKIKASKKL